MKEVSQRHLASRQIAVDSETSRVVECGEVYILVPLSWIPDTK